MKHPYRSATLGLLLMLMSMAAGPPLLERSWDFLSPEAFGQASDTCSDGQSIVLDTANKRYKCISTPLIFRTKALNVNQTNTDIGSFAGLPARYIVRRFTVDNASATPTLSTIALRTATGGGGTAIVTAQALSTLSAATTFIDATLAVTTSAQTASTLTIRAVAAAGTTSTCDFTLEIVPLP